MDRTHHEPLWYKKILSFSKFRVVAIVNLFEIVLDILL